MRTSTLALPRVSSRISVSRPREAATSYLRAFCLLLAWLLLLLTALCSEVAVVFVVGTAVRVAFVDRPTHKYDAARLAP